MANVTHPERRSHRSARPARRLPPAASPRLIEEAVRIFLALGVTPQDLHIWATPGSVFTTVADAMEAHGGVR